jgi:hypothetical protein
MRQKRKPSKLGRIIASRNLKKLPLYEEATVSFGVPRRHPKGDWVCPFLIEESGKAHSHQAFGIDSVQALLLALEGARATLKKMGTYTQFEEDAKAGPGFPRYIPMNRGRLFEARLALAIERESKRYYEAILKKRKLNIAALKAEVTQRRKMLSLLEGALQDHEGHAVEWEAQLKKWNPKKTVV